jgi:uncharacterized membrane protein
MLKQIDFHGLPPAAVDRMFSRARRPEVAVRDEVARKVCHHAVATA